ncbi:MAG: hypothetical protein RIC85_01630 [Gammaproteobacteria bacterium]
MNWDAAGAIGEVIGAGAVVISVIYLAMQVRRQTDQARLAATHELAGIYNESLSRLIDDPELGEIWLKSASGYADLPSNERLRMASFYQQLMRFMEQQHVHVNKGHIDPAFFQSLNLTYFEWIRFPGIHQWWEVSKGQFEEEFRERVDKQIAEAKKKGYASSFKQDRDGST